MRLSKISEEIALIGMPRLRAYKGFFSALLKSVDIPDQFPDSEPYYPNCVEYDLDQLIENDRFYGGAGYKYTALVRESLEKVRREPFVTSISHITVKENDKKVEILVWTNYHQPGVLRVRKDFKYEVRNGNLVRNE